MSEIIVWTDVETSGKSPETDDLLEIAACITDMSGEKIGNSFSRLVSVKNLSTVILNSEEKIQKMHEESGLWKELWTEQTKTTKEIDKDFCEWINTYTTKDDLLYFGGNSITLDRIFIRLNLPETYKLLSYRSVDVTSVSLMVQSNSQITGFRKLKNHRALSDVENSIEEYKYYLNVLRLNRIFEEQK